MSTSEKPESPSGATNTPTGIGANDNYDVCQVLSIVAKYGGGVNACKGKDVIAIFGEQQSGKSTTINALTLGPLGVGIDGDDWEHAVYAPPCGTPVSRVASMGSGMIGCTPAPKGYPLGDKMILDTRGLFDIRYPNEMVAATILTEIALKEAKSIRLVFLMNINSKFQNGFVGMQAFGEMFGKLVKDPNIPILFLFNNPPPSRSQRKPAKGKAAQQAMLNRLCSWWDKIYNTYQNEMKNFTVEVLVKLRTNYTRDDKLNYEQKQKLSRLFERHSIEHLAEMLIGTKALSSSPEDMNVLKFLRDTIRNDQQYQTREQDTLYIEIMKKGFDEYKRRQGFRGMIPGVAKENPCMIGFIDPQDRFSIDEVKAQMHNLGVASFNSLDFSHYNENVEKFRTYFTENIRRFSDLLCGQQLLLKYPERFVSEMEVERKRTVKEYRDDLEDLKTNGDREDLVVRYKKKYASEKSEAIRQMDQELVELYERKERLKDEQLAFFKAPPERDEVPWCSKSDYHPICLVEYKIPYEGEPEEVVESGDKEPYKVVSRHSGDYRVYFSHGSSARSFFRLFCDKVVARGHVVFMVKPMNNPANKDVCSSMDATLREFDEKIGEMKRRKQSLVDQSVAEIGETIELLMEGAEGEISLIGHFSDFRAFVEKISAQLPDHCGSLDHDEAVNVIKMHYEVAHVFHNPAKTNKAFEQFFSLYDSVEEAKKNSQSIVPKLNMSDMNVERLERTLKEEFDQLLDGHDGTQRTHTLIKKGGSETVPPEWVEVEDPDGNPYLYDKTTCATKPCGGSAEPVNHLSEGGVSLPEDTRYGKKLPEEEEPESHVQKASELPSNIIKVHDDDGDYYLDTFTGERCSPSGGSLKESEPVPVKEVPVKETPAKDAPAEEAPIKEAPAQEVISRASLSFASWEEFLAACGINQKFIPPLVAIFEKNMWEVSDASKLTEKHLMEIQVPQGPCVKILEYLGRR